MSWRVRLLAASVHYGEGFRLHTALSGAVDALEELYLLIDADGAVIALAEIRENVRYLSGLSPQQVRHYLIEALGEIDWRGIADGAVPPIAALPALPRTLLDCAFADLAARRANQPLAVHLGGAFSPSVETNQCLQLSNPGTLSEQAERFVARGYRKIKLRIGGGDFAADLARLQELRDRFGSDIELAVDANGTWTAAEALDRLPRLAPFGLGYIEQPVPPGDIAALERAVELAPAPVMLDEAASDLAAIETIVAGGVPVWVHLKLVKMGCIADLLAAAALLHRHDIPFMVGQMNEGGAATAATVHCAMAARPRFAELYGADGLIDDPVSGVAYRDGGVELAEAPGIGVTLDAEKCDLLWETWT